MSMAESLEKAKIRVADIKKKIKYNKANKARADEAALQYELMKCRGELELCAKDFKRAIRNHSSSIQQGIREHHDTLVQEQNLWDAAVGYMLVKDAIFALTSVNSYDSVAHAYDMLDSAMKQISGKKTDLSKFFHFGSKKRTEYGFVTSKTAIQEKEELLNSFFDELKKTGDIDECFQKAVSSKTETDVLSDALNNVNPLFKAVDDLPDDVDINGLGDQRGYTPSRD